MSTPSETLVVLKQVEANSQSVTERQLRQVSKTSSISWPGQVGVNSSDYYYLLLISTLGTVYKFPICL